MRELKKKKRSRNKNRIVFGVFVFIASALFAWQAMAVDLELFGNPLTFKGYINQSVQFGVAGDKYDTWSGLQQAITEALLEMEYLPTDNMKVFVSGQLFKDWAYNIYSTNDDWGTKDLGAPGSPNVPGESRRFKQARNEMSLRTDYEDVLKECHVTWSPPGFNFRIGKQIVSWGRMDGVRIMDQINPTDRRLGPSDVEFETSIVPIWLAKAEYYPGWVPPFLDELGIEFTFNPNADFIPNKTPATGNDEHGIWGVDRKQVLGPLGTVRIGKLLTDYDDPEDWSEGHEYAVRIKGTFPDSTYFTLNFFDGVQDDATFMPDFTKSSGTLYFNGAPLPVGTVPGMNFLNVFDDKGRQIAEPYLTGKYGDQRYAGFTFSRDFSNLYISWLGGVSPLVRCEFIYEFDTLFTKAAPPSATPYPDYNFEEHDVLFGGLGVDWKFKWNLLNPRRYFNLVPQFSMRHIRDYPDDVSSGGYYTYLQNPGGSTVSENTYAILIRMDTWYLHDKLNPMIIWARDIGQDMEHKHAGSTKSDMWLIKLKYEPNHIWSFKAQYTKLYNNGNKWYRYIHNKDNISFTVQYQF